MYVKKNSWVKHLDFILADLLCINLTLLIAYFLRNGVRNVYALKEYRTLLFAIMALHFCISFFSNTYSDILRRGYFQEFKRVLVHNTINAMCNGIYVLYSYRSNILKINDFCILGNGHFCNVFCTYLLKNIFRKKRLPREEAN